MLDTRGEQQGIAMVSMKRTPLPSTHHRVAHQAHDLPLPSKHSPHNLSSVQSHSRLERQIPSAHAHDLSVSLGLGEVARKRKAINKERREDRGR